MVFQQGTLDCLYGAKAAIDRAIAAYEGVIDEKNLSADSGPLYETIDNIESAHQELLDAKSVALGRKIRI